MRPTQFLALLTLISIILMPIASAPLAHAAYSHKICKTAIYDVYGDVYVVKICAWKDLRGNSHVEFNVGKLAVFTTYEYKNICYFSFFGWCLLWEQERVPVSAGIIVKYIGKALWSSNDNQVQWIRDPVYAAGTELLLETKEVNTKIFKIVNELIKDKINDVKSEEIKNIIINVGEIKNIKELRYISSLIDELSTVNELSENVKTIYKIQKYVNILLSNTILLDESLVITGCINNAIYDLNNYKYSSPNSIVNGLINDIEHNGLCLLIKVIDS